MAAIGWGVVTVLAADADAGMAVGTVAATVVVVEEAFLVLPLLLLLVFLIL